MPFCCVECKPCNGGARAPLKCWRTTKIQLRRAFGKMKAGGGGGPRRRRRRAGSFSSVRAVFWPLMSMRSDADARTDDRPPSASTDDDGGGGARAASPSLDDTPGTASVTAARVLALQTRLGEAAPPLPPATAKGGLAPAREDTPADDATSATTAVVRVLALQTRLAGGEAAAPAALTTATTPTTDKAGSIRVQAVREHAAIVDDHHHRYGDVEEACRSFEKHLVEMLVDERKVTDLTDVEEMLCCWEKLRSPVFVQLVARFYGDICVDLFFSGSEQTAESSDSESK